MVYSPSNPQEITMDDIRDLIYPVGSIYLSVKNVNPSTFIGGVWVSWGSGRVPVGVDSGQTEFNSSEKTGGEKTHVLTTNEMPSHGHTSSTTSDGSHTHSGRTGMAANVPVFGNQIVGKEESSTSFGEFTLGGGGHSHTITVQNTGGGAAHNNLQPYITCYMYKRTA